MDNVKLAIVIPYYKYTFFEATLGSLKTQTDKRFKVYIGDDASSENPTDLLKKYKDDFTFVYKRFETNLGGSSLVKQWERCLEMTKNEDWVMILGDDDTISDNFVAEFYNHIEENSLEIDVVRYATVVINEHGEQISKIHEHPKLETSTDFLMRKLKGGTRSSLSEFIFKKQALNRIKFKNLPLAWYSDYLAVLECSNFGNMYTINDALVSFRLSGLNITSKKNDLTLKNVATFNFYYHLIANRGAFFSKEQKETLFFMLEKTFLDNKKNVNFWRLLTHLYVVKLQIKRYFNFIVKVINSVLKKFIND
jgi:glycosyltransferase involved in cell wall biosynthesis